MNAREIDAKARLLFDEYGLDAMDVTAKRADALGDRSDPEAKGWQAVEARVAELVRQDLAAETAEIETEIRRAGGRSRLSRALGQLFGARKTA